MLPQLTIAIPTHQRSQRLKQTLDSCLRQSLPSHLFEILVVSNIPDKATEDVIEDFRQCFPHIRHYCSHKVNISMARNLALTQAKASLVYFLDDDCELKCPQQIEKIIQLHQKYPMITAIGGGYSSKEKASQLCRLYNLFVNRWLLWHQHQPRQICLPGGNVCYKKQQLDQELFDPSFTTGGEETEFHLRLQNLGLQFLYSNSLMVNHNFVSSWLHIPRKAFLQGRAHKRFAQKNGLKNIKINFKFLKNIQTAELIFLSFYLSFVFWGRITSATRP